MDKINTLETDELPTAIESFRRGWKQVLAGETLPISEIWDGIDVDRTNAS